MATKTMPVAFMRNKFIPFSQANLSIASSTVLYGLSVYTTGSALWNKSEKQLYYFRLKDHYRRLINSTQIMDFNTFAKQWPYKKFEATISALIAKNKVKQDVLIRCAVFIDEELAGTKIHDLKTSLSIFIYPLGPFYPKPAIDVCVSSWARTPDNAIPARAKVNGSYANACLMKNEALINGYDDAIALDMNGHVAEGAVANFFIVRDGMLVTPDLSTDVLEGITRSTIIQLAADLGINCQERSIDRTELYISEEAFFCGSSALVSPIGSIDRRKIGNGKPGPITTKLHQAYKDVQSGKNSTYSHWLVKPSSTKKS